tara:strand:- start:383 stop:871 length:489 start_codon:yes stop_codon:yes gene_type:complete
MAYQRLQVSEGLAVIPSDTVPIPDPATKALSGTAGFHVGGALNQASGEFLSAGIQKNAIIYNTTLGQAYFVTEVVSDIKLLISPSVVGSTTDDYVIYNAATKAATLYIGTTGDLVVEMASERDSQATPALTFYNVPSSAFLPILVTKVGISSSPNMNIIALW